MFITYFSSSDLSLNIIYTNICPLAKPLPLFFPYCKYTLSLQDCSVFTPRNKALRGTAAFPRHYSPNEVSEELRIKKPRQPLSIFHFPFFTFQFSIFTSQFHSTTRRFVSVWRPRVVSVTRYVPEGNVPRSSVCGLPSVSVCRSTSRPFASFTVSTAG